MTLTARRRGKMKINRVVGIILLTVLICGLTTGCFDKREVDDLAYVVAMGFDKGDTNALRITCKMAKPKEGEGGGGGGGGDKEPVSTITVEAPTIYSGLNMINSSVSKQINLSHNKALVFSKELAEAGIEPYLNAIMRGREFRPNMPVVVSRGKAGDYLNSVKPELVMNYSKYFEMAYRSYTYTGFFTNTQFHYFYNNAKSLYKQPVAILVGVNRYETVDDFDKNHSTNGSKGRDEILEGDFMAGDVTKISENKGEAMGLAVFDGAKMVGELDGEEASCHAMVSGEFNIAYATFPDPKVADKYVVFQIRESRSPEHKVSIVDGKPQISVKVILEGDFQSIQSDVNYEDGENLKLIEKAVEDHLKNSITAYLNKTAKEFHSDICGFGADIAKKFPTLDDLIKFNWKSKYRYASFNVEVDFKARRPGLMLRTMPYVSSEGEEGTGR
jgi:spore germination protein KC